MTEISSCPFCGGEAKAHYHNHSMTWSVRCNDWRCPGKSSCEDQTIAIEAWNTRQPSSPTVTGEDVIERVAWNAYLAGFSHANGVECAADLGDTDKYHAAHIGAQRHVAAIPAQMSEEDTNPNGVSHEIGGSFRRRADNQPNGSVLASVAVSQPAVERATLIRDEMINVARSLADRDCGAMQSEMRDAQIKYLARVLATRPAFDTGLLGTLKQIEKTIGEGIEQVSWEEANAKLHEAHGIACTALRPSATQSASDTDPRRVADGGEEQTAQSSIEELEYIAGHETTTLVVAQAAKRAAEVIAALSRSDDRLGEALDDEFFMALIEPVTKAIVFEDCGNTSDWQENTNLGIAAIKTFRTALDHNSGGGAL